MPNRIGQEIENSIIKMIESNAVKPGNRLPAERALASQFKVSRNTVREAIRALTEKGIIFSKRGSGSFVTDNAQDKIAQRFINAVKRKKSELMDIFEIRKMLEPAVAAKAAVCAEPEDIETLSGIIESQQKAFEKDGDTAKWDLSFHGALVQTAKNSALATMYATLLKMMEEGGVSDIQSPERAESSIASHRTIFENIRNKDSEGASLSMKQHMNEIEILLIQKIEGSIK